MKNVTILLLIFFTLLGCSKEDNVELSSKNLIDEFVISDYKIKGRVNVIENTITVNWPYDINEISNVKPIITVSNNATIDPPSGETIDLKNDLSFVVTAENGDIREFDLILTERKKAALLVIDVQNSFLPVHNNDQFLENIASLITTFHESDNLVVFVKDQSGDAISSAISPAQNDVIITKPLSNSFASTSLNAVLQDNDVGTIYMTGLASEGCITSSCRGGYNLSYKVILVKDAHSTLIDRLESLVETTNQNVFSFADLIETEEVSF